MLGEGNSPNPSLLGGDSYLGENAAYVIYPLSQITRIFPKVETILFFQSLALSLAVVPLFNIARNLGKLHFGTCSALVAVYSTYVSVHSVNLSGFSPAILALPAIFYLLYLGLSVRGNFQELGWKFHAQYWFLIFWILICRADLGLAIAGFGILLIVEKKRLLGLITAGVCLAWLLAVYLIIQRVLADGNISLEAYSSYGGSPLGVFWGILTDPIGVIRDLRTEQNIRSIITLFAPLVFLPLVRPRYILPAVPLYALYLIADVEVDILGEAEQNIIMIAFLFVAMVFALQKIGTILVEKVRVNFFLVWVLVVASMMFYIQDSASSPYRSPWSWNSRQGVLEEVTDSVLQDSDLQERVGASTNLLTKLAERDNLFEIKAENLDLGQIVEQVRGADVALIDITTFPDDADAESFISAMIGNGWRQIQFSDEVYRFER